VYINDCPLGFTTDLWQTSYGYIIIAKRIQDFCIADVVKNVK